ncbi:MAG: hypothetical protein M1820_000764 [Bogoriella megaspora]|nr:MAG: hypothetical protein M1820_000764 [Bogoriella megaspora]
MTVTVNPKKLQWTQRVALIRQNLHSASRTGDFTFFKTLQAQAFFEGTDYVATLSAGAGDEADTVIATLDNLNAGIAYVHQDAFKNVYDRAKEIIASDDDFHAKRASIRVDVSQQKQMAELAIDKMTNSAISLIEQQALPSRDAVAHVWITGTTVIADAVEVCLMKINEVEYSVDDLIGLEDSYNVVKNAVGSGVSALKAIFNLMSSDSNTPEKECVQSGTASSYAKGMLRRFSTAISNSPQQNTVQHRPEPPLSPTKFKQSPSALRQSISISNPTAMPPLSAVGRIAPHLKLNAIPGTPVNEPTECPFALNAAATFNTNPFETSTAFSSQTGYSSEKSEGTGVLRRLSTALWPGDASKRNDKHRDEPMSPSRTLSISSARSENVGPLDNTDYLEDGHNFGKSLLVVQPQVAV